MYQQKEVIAPEGLREVVAQCCGWNWFSPRLRVRLVDGRSAGVDCSKGVADARSCRISFNRGRTGRPGAAVSLGVCWQGDTIKGPGSGATLARFVGEGGAGNRPAAKRGRNSIGRSAGGAHYKLLRTF